MSDRILTWQTDRAWSGGECNGAVSAWPAAPPGEWRADILTAAPSAAAVSDRLRTTDGRPEHRLGAKSRPSPMREGIAPDVVSRPGIPKLHLGRLPINSAKRLRP